MTHNFDFFRTVQSRFVKYSKCLMATKTPDGIVLSKAEGIQNIFANDWKLKFHSDAKKKIASIPFLRNLVEFKRGTGDANFIKLTSLLHARPESMEIKISDLDKIYSSICGDELDSPNGDKVVVDLIDEQAQECVLASSGVNFENKIVLAIAIRLEAERYMIKNIADNEFVKGIKLNQTRELLDRFKRDFANDLAKRVLDSVLLMTPENIHLNSFMYEPIIDMSDDHLRKLYNQVKELK